MVDAQISGQSVIKLFSVILSWLSCSKILGILRIRDLALLYYHENRGGEKNGKQRFTVDMANALTAPGRGWQALGRGQQAPGRGQQALGRGQQALGRGRPGSAR